jgi:hypothetical protein
MPVTHDLRVISQIIAKADENPFSWTLQSSSILSCRSPEQYHETRLKLKIR